jgi:hypothetical protein
MGQFCTKRAGQRSRTVRGDWLAWLPEEMDQLFGATRSELECSNGILSVALDEALALCEQEQFTIAKESRLATLYSRGFSSFVASTAALISTGWSEPVPGRVYPRCGPPPFHGAPDKRTQYKRAPLLE